VPAASENVGIETAEALLPWPLRTVQTTTAKVTLATAASKNQPINVFVIEFITP